MSPRVRAMPACFRMLSSLPSSLFWMNVETLKGC